MSNIKAAHHRGTYQAYARRVVEAAYNNPGTICRRCGYTFDQYAQRQGAARAKWTAGHVNDGEIGGLLVPEHAHCNYSAGAIAGNRKRTTNHRTWWT